jgi:hypothetical protein
MNNEEIGKLFEELDGKVELGMDEEALALCETILNEAEDLDVNVFGELCSTIGMFSDDMSAWRERLAARFSVLDECERLAGACFWVPFLAAADAAWDEIKPYVSLRQLDGDSMLLVCLSAVSAGDADWCRKTLPVLGAITRHHSAECSHRLAYAALQGFMEDHLGALEAMQGFKIEDKWFETYLELLTKSTTGHFRKSLEHLTEEIKALGGDPKMEILLPGNDRARLDDLMKSISKAKAAVKDLSGD